ncbi:MAG: hypothetical protein GY807_12845 [Gammaproteobacteria bacterium]|nr:hypothetical protein [Gammaproteobacteria bacterium]
MFTPVEDRMGVGCTREEERQAAAAGKLHDPSPFLEPDQVVDQKIGSWPWRASSVRPSSGKNTGVKSSKQKVRKVEQQVRGDVEQKARH